MKSVKGLLGTALLVAAGLLSSNPATAQTDSPPADSLLVPTLAKPLIRDKQRGYRQYQMQHRRLNRQLRRHPNPAYVAPAAADFPGAVPATAPRISTELVLRVRVGSNGRGKPWAGYRRAHGTGLYVPAGETVSLYLADSDAQRHLRAQIGVHSDELTGHAQLTREGFDLTRTFALKPGRTDVYSPYGGLLLVVIPDTDSLKELRIKVSRAVRAPYFERGKTSVAEWQQTIRQYPAPWAELVSDNISLTVPAARLRTLEDPEQLLAFWDTVLAADAKLAALPAARRYPERIIVDRQVAYGYMFASARRIVVPDDDEGCRHMLDVEYLREHGSWGHFHELGHQHQFKKIDFAGLGEVSVNLYTMYVYDKVLHKGLYNHPELKSRQMVAEKVTRYLANAPSFKKWQSNAFLALCMYIQLIDAFGWEPIEQVYQQYRQLPRRQYPSTEAAKRDYWFAAISTATHRNLAPFFAQWQVPVGEAAAKAAAAYPTWLPAEMQRK